MYIPEQAIEKLTTLGYLSPDEPDDVDKGVLLFQQNHGNLFLDSVISHHHRVDSSETRTKSLDGLWGPVCQKLLDQPRTCMVPDIARNSDGIIAEARWPEECAMELRFSNSFRKAPGLSEAETQSGIAFALAEWNTAFRSPLNGEVYSEYLAEWAKVGDFDIANPPDQFVLWVGTVKHEVGHALGFGHTPSDRRSVMFPSMAGQWLLNSTDLANMRGRGYSQIRALKLRHVTWSGNNGTEIWATLGALRGPTLAWSMLSTGRCGQRAEQRYDSTVSWNSTKINLPPIAPPDPPPPPPPGPGAIVIVDGDLHLKVSGVDVFLKVIEGSGLTNFVSP